MKFLPCQTALEARQKSIAARSVKHPNWWDDQLAKHLAQPNVYPHPARYQNDMVHDVVVDEETGAAEIEVPDSDTNLYPDDIDKIRSERSIGVAQGPK